ncbi:putative bifunctional diguanylate cyclase/phosphodiesterase [Vibrio panuliri]|uniref:Diguanylate phosphodiesterase n=1 Tax=Vibrio panuliri TaxID=1381081 RepID=A0ABX3FFD1_9VIBR|nr:bifunctional diguanylate cyclase/phosphodiesterase [Vibrio panuliri]KAB1454255.1 bifunctional diguanylate cyclase/phosphodiesterase [Vibrio panuliri]OLQ88947.1 diguanylate phosphodiesterase [Vibrio panuliri]
MINRESTLNKLVNSGVLIKVAYIAAVMLISSTLILQHELVGTSYILFPVGMLIALFTQNLQRRKLFALLSFLHILIGGVIEPLEVEAIEKSFLLLPLCYLILFPSTIWPIVVAVLLISHYFFSVPSEGLIEMADDSVKLMLITIFATSMTYYKIKSDKQLAKYRHDSLSDVLTHLPNRRAFYQFIEQADCNKGNLDHVLLKIDIDNFKDVNDSFGPQQADKLLKFIATRLKQVVTNKAELFRMEGDEFIIVVREKANIEQQVSGIVREISRPERFHFELDRGFYQVTFSVGISSLKKATNNRDIWLKNVDVATVKAKSTGKNRVRWYDESLLDETIRAHQIEVELEQAIRLNQFVLHYQPKVSMRDQNVKGAEALIRWEHPELGMISPIEFISIAEKTKQIIMIGRWVIKEACEQAKRWHDAGMHVQVSVNVSTVQFAHDDLLTYIRHILRRTNLPANLLQIEITETTLMKDTERVTKICRRLQDEGVTIAVDDFGIAYSSLNYLKHLPIDVLKIDKSFVDDCVIEHHDHMLVRTIVQLGHNMGKWVIAEGVEYESQRQLLCQEGCDDYQGYLFSKPITAQEFSERFVKQPELELQA